MRKLFFTLITFVLLISSQSATFAQKYFTYDGDKFSILITCDNGNTKVTNVEFSFNNKWVTFSLIGNTSMENTKEGGFIFYCRDGKGKYFAVDYYRDGNYVLCHSVAANGDADILNGDFTLKENPWRLEFRKE